MKERKMTQYIYGPVPSRRLGRSLGLDLIPHKACTYDCVYCQLGRTANTTMERKEWVPTKEVVAQLKDRLDSRPDYITLSGSGEPTLHTGLKQLIAEVKNMTDIPVAVITNGSLLWLPEVRDALLEADLAVPSLDAGSDDIFQYVNRPHPEIGFDRMLAGLQEFRQVFNGQYWLEVLLLGGVTTPEARVEALSDCIKRIGPDRVQVNTVARPPAESYAMPVGRERLEEIAARLYPVTELVLPWSQTEGAETGVTGCDNVLDLLRRRPCSITDIATGLRLHPHEAAKCVERLVAARQVRATDQQGTRYYEAVL